MRIRFLCISVLRVASGPRVKLATIFSKQMYRVHTNAYGSKLDLAVKRLNINV